MNKLGLTPVIYHYPVIFGDTDEWYTYFIGKLLSTTTLNVPIGKSEYTKISQSDNIIEKNTNWFISDSVENFKTVDLDKFRKKHFNNPYFLNKDLNGFVTVDDVVTSLNEYIRLRDGNKNNVWIDYE